MWLATLAIFLCARAGALPTPLVTGNGYGFAVYSVSSGTLTKLFAHPYSFASADPKDPLGEGVPTTNFLTSLSWDAGSSTGAARAAEYLEQSHVISADGGRRAYFMPFGLRRNALVAVWRGGPGPAPCLRIAWARKPLAVVERRAEGRPSWELTFEGLPESLLVVALDRGEGKAADGCFSGHAAWALMPLENARARASAELDLARWRGGLTPAELVEREAADFEAWRVKPSVTFRSEAERRVWRQSEAVLRMGQSREPDEGSRHGRGLIVAALPDGSWSTPWVRDMAYATAALAAMGHEAEARRALEAYFNARPVGRMRAEVQGRPYQVSVVRYFGDGAEEPYFTMEGAANVELDGWGLVLWALGQYTRRYGALSLPNERTYRGGLYESALKFVVEPLLAQLEPRGDGLIVAADTSIWEERQPDRKHFAFTTAAALAGLRAFDRLAAARRDRPTRQRLAPVLAGLERGFTAAFIKEGSLRGTAEGGVKNDVDGAALAAIGLDIGVSTAVIAATAARMPALAVASGGYRRVRSTYEDPKIFEYWYERQEFVFTDLGLAEAYLRLGRPEDAAPLLRTIVEKAEKDHDFVPEMYVSLPCALFPGRIGDPTGAIPMVGYGAGAYVLHLLRRQALSAASAGRAGPAGPAAAPAMPPRHF